MKTTSGLGSDALGSDALGPDALGSDALGPDALGPDALGSEEPPPEVAGSAGSSLAERATAIAAECAAASMLGFSEDELLEFLDGMHHAQQMLHAALLHAVREVDGRGIPAARQAATANMWLRARLRISSSQAGRLLTNARLLDADPVLDAATVAGDVNAEQLAAISQSLRELPRDLDSELRKEAGSTLIRWTAQLDPVQLRTAGRRILLHVDPDAGDAADEAWLRRSERDAREQRFLTLTSAGDGRFRVRGILDSESAAVVTAAIDPLCRPGRTAESPAAARNASSIISSAAAGHAGSSRAPGAPADAGPGRATDSWRGTDSWPPTGLGASTGLGSSTGLEPTTGLGPSTPLGPEAEPARTPGQRRADALVEVCRLALAGGSLPEHGGDRPQLNVTVSYDALRQDFGPGLLDNGEPVSASTVRRLACDARVLPLVLGGKSQILDAGRSRRTVDGAQRRALIARDRGCSFPGCDRPARWCEAHHMTPWSAGGKTDLDELALLCGFHHHVIHGDSGWEIRPGPDGRPEFLPPASLDPQRRSRQNSYHRRT